MKHAVMFALLSLTLAAAERPVPAPGVAVPAGVRAELSSRLNLLQRAIAPLEQKHGPASLVVADVRIFSEAVRYALTYNEFLKPEEFAKARKLLDAGMERARALGEGKTPWASQTGLVVRGYVSKIDGSVQPYGLVIPSNFRPELAHRWRVDAWFHGRSETLTEVNFLDERMTNPGQFTPADTIVVHLYGRYCNANKFAGEVDLFEALDAVRKHYRVDEDRINIRGFSMGGAAAWHIAAHYAGRWSSAAPGAGFSETAEFLNVFQNEQVKPAWWEQKLYRLYDATVYAANFFNLPLVAYSGEKDRQIQAALVMERELAKEGIRMRHVIGPDTPHRYHPDSKIEIDRSLDAINAAGRDRFPHKLKFVTYTLRYNRMKWVRIDALARHWEQGRIDAELAGPSRLDMRVSGVTAFSLLFPAGASKLDVSRPAEVAINGQILKVPQPMSDRSWNVSFVLDGNSWKAGALASGTRKRHGLQGPIDDAFMSSFLIVKPSALPKEEKTAAWVKSEMDRAITEWRRHFRGEARVKADNEVTDQDIAASNLVLWGDAAGNALWARMAGQLPALKGADAPGRVPVMIYPNPLNSNRYVVLNSGFTFREYDYLNNARQIPKLPDWAVIDISVPPDGRWPGRVSDAGFFDESWRLQ